MIDTTVNIDVNIYNRITRAALENKIPMKRIVHVLFKLMLFERPVDTIIFKRLRYQERGQGREWKCFHIQLNEGSYEACFDMRKLFKRSLSFILSIAVELYLDRVVDELRNGSTDNYAEFYNINITHSDILSSFFVSFTLPKSEDIPSQFIMPET